MILTTAMAVEGRPVKEYLDVVTSQVIMGVHVGRDLKALGRSIVGGRSGTYEEEFAKAVREAKHELRAVAETLGADAVIAVALDYEDVGDEMLMVAGKRDRGEGAVSPLPLPPASSVPRTYRSSPDALATSDGSAAVRR
jgi:uncharacterized protein YbjQ (UPF0145 family)